MTASDNRAEWWSGAACLTADPELFFPLSSAGPASRQVTSAKAICARCRIQQACLRYALEAGSVQGIWGGTTEPERRLLRRRGREARAQLAKDHARPAKDQAASPALAQRVPSP